MLKDKIFLKNFNFHRWKKHFLLTIMERRKKYLYNMPLFLRIKNFSLYINKLLNQMIKYLEFSSFLAINLTNQYI